MSPALLRHQFNRSKLPQDFSARESPCAAARASREVCSSVRVALLGDCKNLGEAAAGKCIGSAVCQQGLGEHEAHPPSPCQGLIARPLRTLRHVGQGFADAEQVPLVEGS